MIEAKFKLLLVLILPGLWVQSTSGDPSVGRSVSAISTYEVHGPDVLDELLPPQPAEFCELSLEDMPNSMNGREGARERTTAC